MAPKPYSISGGRHSYGSFEIAGTLANILPIRLRVPHINIEEYAPKPFRKYSGPFIARAQSPKPQNLKLALSFWGWG